MKVMIDGNPEHFINIFRPSGGNGGYCQHWQCNTTGNNSAHKFNTHPDKLPKDKQIKANGHIYVFPSKQ